MFVAGEKGGFSMKKSMQGRMPLAVTDNRLIFTARDGRSIQIHQNNKETNFEEVAGVPVSMHANEVHSCPTIRLEACCPPIYVSF